MAEDTRLAAPARNGQPWTDAEYEEILAAAREGVTDVETVAARLERGTHATSLKVRRLLPVAERSAPVDRALALLRRHQDDPEYDWQRVTLEEPPPRPVIAPPALTGIAGLSTGELVTVAYAVGLAASAVDDDVVARVGEELQHRDLLVALLDYRTERLLRQPGAEITVARATSEAGAWLQRVFPMADHAFPYWRFDGPDDYF
ncbi:hypothetical protein [Georgenia sp. MJ170]|uniref:hypothetical protein n=1 Tax=Georgenia sunbinii TaxID=3117728 RepID=UPI002F268009